MIRPEPTFRLPQNIRPIRYRTRLRIDLARDCFEGWSEIHLHLDTEVDVIRLHSVALLVSNDGANHVASARPSCIKPEPDSETIALCFDQPLPAGDAVVALHWMGAIGRGMRGMYRAGPIIATQFEAADARRVFPCLDEPAFKAVWELTVTGVPSDLTIISNTKLTETTRDASDQCSVRFAPTPPLSSYLLALVIGELAGSAGTTVSGVTLRTFAVPDKSHLVAFSEEIVSAVLPRLEAYFALPYPFDKLDQIAIPEFAAGAMENAGAITYRETILLLAADQAPAVALQRSAEVIAHELSHQWFGNLVTMFWWDDLWLNEAFATWIATKIVAEWNPDMQLWRTFEVGKARALSLDDLRSTHPIRSDVATADQAGESFDTITYEKGAAVLRMLEAFVGEREFRDGIRLYLKRARGGNASAEDLWNAISESAATPVAELAETWVSRPGHPIVSAELLPGARVLKLHQRRFDVLGAEDSGDPPWPVPIVLAYRDGSGIHERRVLLHERECEISLQPGTELTWCVVNRNGYGFFRVQYDAQLFARLISALPELSAIEKISLLADEWALLLARRTPAERFMTLAAQLARESDPELLRQLIGYLGQLEGRFALEVDRDRLRARVLRWFEPTAVRLGLERHSAEDRETRERRAEVLRAVALLARAAPWRERADAYFVQHLIEPANYSGDAELFEPTSLALAREAGVERARWLFELAASTSAPIHKRLLTLAVTSVERPEARQFAIDAALGDSVPAQELPAYVTRLLENPAARPEAFVLLCERWDQLALKASSPFLMRGIIEGLSALPPERYLADTKALLAAHVNAEFKQATAQVLERLELEGAAAEHVRAGLHRYLEIEP